MKHKTFDCVEFQRNVRYQHYLDANGDVDIMIKNMNDRLKHNEMWQEFLERKEKEQQLKTA